MSEYSRLEQALGYVFSSEYYLRTALTHVSFANEQGCESYERLEFLGDAVIELVVSDYIYNLLHIAPGELTRLRARLVSTENLCKVSISLGLDRYVRLAPSLSKLSKKNTADLFESVVGAVYLDGGLNSAIDIIKRFVIIDETHIAEVIKNSVDYKTTLQEMMQAEGSRFEYRVVSTFGPDHDKTFVVGLWVDGVCEGQSEAKSIRSAEENCARDFLQKIHK